MFDYIELKQKTLDWLRPEDPIGAEQVAAEAIDHGDYSIYSYKFDAALEEARTVFVRTAVSTMAKSGDLVVGLHTKHGDTVTASCGTFLHAPIAQLPVKFLIDRYVDGTSSLEVNPGDIFYANEALAGGLHNPDQMAIMPIFHDDELIGWASAALHQAETGAIEPGGMPSRARTRYDEGMRLTPIKLAENYEIRDDLMDMMVNFISRSPRTQEIDVRARCTAVDKLRERVEEIANETGTDFVHGMFRRMIDGATEGALDRVSRWHDGTYRSVGFADTIGDEEALVKVALALRKEGSRVTLDFTGSSPECGSYNTFGHGIAAFLGSYLYPYVFHDLPVSTGAFAPFRFELPEGSIVNASPETSVANCVLLGRTVMSMFHEVFTRMLYSTDPDRTATSPSPQTGSGQITGINQHGVRETNIITYPLNTDAQGARPDMDGMDAHGFFYAPWGKPPNVEDEEESRMLLGFVRALHADTCGFGKFRGGSGTQAIDVVTSPDGVETNHNGRGSRITFSAGIFGGYSPTALLGIAIRNTDLLQRFAAGQDVPPDIRRLVRERAIDGDYEFAPMNRVGSEETHAMHPGDVIVNLNFGGGSIGDPLERPVGALRRDLENGVVSPWAARHVFGAAVGEDGDIDAAATARRRDEVRSIRLDRGVSYDGFADDWASKRPPDHALRYYGTWPEGSLPDREESPKPAAGLPTE